MQTEADKSPPVLDKGAKIGPKEKYSTEAGWGKEEGGEKGSGKGN